jgi:tetratricopeptide (TPR) repeat protein
MLRDRFPDRSFEIFNVAEVAINSHVTREIARECARLDPDLFIVLLGNNEVVGPHGPGTLFGSFSPNLSVIRLGDWLRTRRIGQLFQKWTASNAPFDRWEGMSMFVDHAIHPRDSRLHSVYDHLRSNLTDIATWGQEVRAAVMLCTVPTNLKDCPPFASMHAEDWSPEDQNEWDRIYDLGIALQEEGDFAGALSSFLSAQSLDEHYAELHYRRAQCLAAIGDFDEAHAAYVLARDCDALRFRADSRTNEVIRDVVAASQSPNVQLVDLATACDADSRTPRGTVGNELLLEHVHFTFSGNYVIAQSLFEAITARFEGHAQRSNQDVLSAEECAKRLALTDFDQHVIDTKICMLMEDAPFTNQLGHEDAVAARVRACLEFEEHGLQSATEAAILQYQSALESRPDDWILKRNLAQLLCSQGQFAEAAPYVEQIRNLFPHVPAFEEWQQKNVARMLYAVSVHITNGEVEQAVEGFQEAQRVAESAGFESVSSRLQECWSRFDRTGDLSQLDLNE